MSSIVFSAALDTTEARLNDAIQDVETRANMSGLELKCGKMFASYGLYKYLVDHSYRPNKHLDGLHEVCRI